MEINIVRFLVFLKIVSSAFPDLLAKIGIKDALMKPMIAVAPPTKLKAAP